MDPVKIGEMAAGMETLDVMRSQYVSGNGTAVMVQSKDGEPYATLSVMLKDAPIPPDGQFYLKDWSENEKIAEAFRQSGLATKIDGADQPTAFVVAELWQLTEAVPA